MSTKSEEFERLTKLERHYNHLLAVGQASDVAAAVEKRDAASRDRVAVAAALGITEFEVSRARVSSDADTWPLGVVESLPVGSAVFCTEDGVWYRPKGWRIERTVEGYAVRYEDASAHELSAAAACQALRRFADAAQEAVHKSFEPSDTEYIDIVSEHVEDLEVGECRDWTDWIIHRVEGGFTITGVSGEACESSGVVYDSPTKVAGAILRLVDEKAAQERARRDELA